MEQNNNDQSLRDAVRDAMQDAMRDQNQVMQQMLQTMQAMMARLEVQNRAQPIREEEHDAIVGGRERGFKNLEAPPIRREQQRRDVGLPSRRICDCELGFPEELRSPRARREFEEQAERVEEFLKDPWLVREGGVGGGDTVQVLVPKVVTKPAPRSADRGGGGEDALSSPQARQAALQREAAAVSMAAEDYVRRLEAGGTVDVLGQADNIVGAEDQGSSVKVMCRICFSGENEGSERAMKMLSCKFCNKKYHRSCLKVWAENRDLFH